MDDNHFQSSITCISIFYIQNDWLINYFKIVFFLCFLIVIYIRAKSYELLLEFSLI